MSLLLDALKKAEQAKQGSSLSLEPVDADVRAPSAPINPAVAGVAPGPSLGSAARRAEQEAAKALFTAKKPPMANRPAWLLLGGLSLLSIAAGVFWLWYMLSFPSTGGSQLAPINTTPRPRPLTTAPAASAPTPTAVAAAVAPVQAPKPTPPDVATPKVAEAREPAPAPAPVSPRSRTRRSNPPAAATTPAPAPQWQESPREVAGVNPQLTTAYRALANGDYAVAKQHYQAVADNDPFNLDAWLGLATVAASTGDLVHAQNYYRKALEIDPKNTVAHAGLAALQSNQNAESAESQLRAQIAAQPTAAAPYSALGHIHASQGRWGEAQQAFFDAYRLEPSNADYAFNLAVSLDHLEQRKLAREYYGKALTLSASHPAGFDKAEAASRMNQLAP